jgi:hypothetical protein
LKTLITYIRIAWAIDLIETSFAPDDIHQPDQFDSRFTRRSLVDLNLSLFIRPSGVGSPKYFSSCVVHGMFRTLRAFSFLSFVHSGPNIIDHFAGLISWPIHFSYVFSRCLIASVCSSESCINKSVSSANRRWDIPGALLHIWSSCKLP